jgi:hypothetical protein
MVDTYIHISYVKIHKKNAMANSPSMGYPFTIACTSKTIQAAAQDDVRDEYYLAEGHG